MSDENYKLKEIIELVEDMDLPDGAYWQVIADIMGWDVDDVQDAVVADPEFFGWERHKP